jgi:tetratricopeptide (TPR) repeat protein
MKKPPKTSESSKESGLAPLICLILGIVWQVPLADAAGIPPEQVFEKASPSVVQLKSLDSQGSGVVINENGWILTNLHVAAAGLPMTVTISDANGNVARKVEGASLFRVHPVEDVAILKFNPGPIKPKPARVSKVAPKPAATCFAISSPAGNAGALTNTITQGVVSTPRRKLDDGEFIQFSAAVNPGSSGGALLDQNADLIGLITSKQEGGEGVAFATPLVGMDWKIFVEPSKRVGDRDRCNQAIQISQRARVAGMLSMFGNPGGELPEQLATAAYYSRMALTEFPTDETAFSGLIEVYYLAGKQDVCLELARSAWKATGSSTFLSLEARSLNLLGRKDEASEAYSKALKADDGKASPSAAGNLAQILAERKEIEWGRVAYLARWGLVSQDANNEAAKRELSEVFEKAVAQLPQTAANVIRAKTSDFTVTEMSEFPAKLPSMPKGVAEILRAFDPAVYQPLLASSAGPLIVPPDMIPKSDRKPDADFVIPMQSQVEAFIPAAGGRIGLLVSTESDTVEIFDIALGDSIDKVQCPKGTLAAKWVIGGLDHWALVDKKHFRIERFELLKRNSKPEVIEPKGGKLPWDAIGAITSPYRDDIAWIFLRESDRRITAALYHFGIGMIRTPDPSTVPVAGLRMWGENQKQRFRIDPPGMTCAPEAGGEVFLTMDPAAFRLNALTANYVFGELAFPFSNGPAKWFLDAHSAKTWVDEKMTEKWNAEGDGNMGTPLLMAPVHGSSRVIQLSRKTHLVLQIRAPETGHRILPVLETNYEYYQDPGGRKLSEPKRFEVISHRSTPRVAIFDFLTNKLLSVRMGGWDYLEK